MRIQSKLFATFLLSSVFLTVTLIAVIQWSIGKGMIDYVNAKELEALQPVRAALVQQYLQASSWSSIERDPKIFFDIIFDQIKDSNFIQNRPPGSEFAPPNRRVPRHFDPPSLDRPKQDKANNIPRPPPKGPGHRSPNAKDGRLPKAPYGFALLDQNKVSIIDRYNLASEQDVSLIELNISDITVGYLVIATKKSLTDGYELNFVKQQKTTLFLLASVLLILTLLIALPLARHIIRPIKQLASGMNDLAQGKFEQKLALKRQDEFKTLERDFNELANTLSFNENSRKRWLADVSHELRTPVSVLKGEIEAVIDGIRPLNIEQFLSAQEEILQLERLIEDLHELARSDLGTLHYQKHPVDFATLIAEEVQKFTCKLNEQHMQLNIHVPNYPVIFNADEKRIKQLISNLVINILRYAHGADTVNVCLTNSKLAMGLVIEDNGPGVPDEQLEQIFDHLFRGEQSRNRKTGGSGLGLNICTQIVKAHGGTINASRSTLGGLAVHMQFNHYQAD
jgi:two-component system sensor histidine kinase BaeS